MNLEPGSISNFSSTYHVNRRRKEAIVHPLQAIIDINIQPQLDFVHAQLQRLAHHTQELVALPEDNRALPTLESLSVQSLLEDQQQNLQEIQAQVERTIEIVLADTEDIDPNENRWPIFTSLNRNKGTKLIEKPIIYMPLDFYRTHDLNRKPRSVPQNPSEYLPDDEEYFEASGCLDPPEYLIPSHQSYLESRKKRSYNTSEADPTTNKFYCHLEAPPPLSNNSLSLPNSGDTFLKDGSPYYKKLDPDDNIYIPHLRSYGKVISWVNGEVVFKPKFYFSNCTNTFAEDDHWIPNDPRDDLRKVKFGNFVIALPSLNPTRRLLAYVSPYTVADSHFLTKKNWLKPLCPLVLQGPSSIVYWLN